MRTYPVSLAIVQATHVAQERRLGPICLNAIQGIDRNKMVSIEALDAYVQDIVSDTKWFKGGIREH